MKNRDELLAGHLPAWFRIGEGRIVIGVYPEEGHCGGWPTHELLRILYDQSGSSYYIPYPEKFAPRVINRLSSTIGPLNPMSCWESLKQCVLNQELRADELLGFEFARTLISAGRHSPYLSYGLAVAQAIFIFRSML